MPISVDPNLTANQTWQSVTRSNGVTYYNTTGKPIIFKGDLCSISNGGSSLVVNGVSVGMQGAGYNGSGTQWYTGSPVIIPINASYVWSMGGSWSTAQAYEFR